jgi:hypothetical protein
VFELRRVREEKAIQKGATVETQQSFPVSARRSRGEGIRIGRNDLWIEPNDFRGKEQIGSSKIAAKGIQGLPQDAAAVLLVRLRPQVGDQLVPGKPLATCNRQ